MKWLMGLFIAALLWGCADKLRIPKDVIAKEKMEKIFWDMLQADRYVNYYIINRGDSTVDKKKEQAIFYERVFNMHGITKEEFVKSYKFYMSRPDITKVMFDSIAARGERQRADVYVKPRNPFLEKRDSLLRRDSLRRVDSLRKIDSIDSVDTRSTSEMSDSAIRELLFK